MGRYVFGKLWTSCLFVVGAAVGLAPTPANAFPKTGSDWEMLYGAIPTPNDQRCQLCHVERNGGDPWNGYGWAIRAELRAQDSACDLDGMDGVDNFEAFICIEMDDSDMDPGASDNITEITEGAQPGWTAGANNTIFPESGVEDPCNLPPEGLEPYDPPGTPPPGDCGTGGTGGAGGTGGTGGDDMIPPGQLKRRTIVVKPGRSIQEALDGAQEGARIYVLSGVYKEGRNGQNALEITKSNIRLVGQTNKKKRAILKSTGNQINGIVVVPPDISAAAQPEGRVVEDRTDCMGCHSDMAPPFPLHPDVPIVSMNDEDPWLYNVEIIGITIDNFSNNGLFTEHVDGFLIHDVESINNSNYGIFPTLSKNGAITDSRSVGSDLDSALWVETSENVDVIGNFVADSVNGIEVSNSDDIRVYNNEMRNNTIGAAILLLPDIFDNRGSAKRIDVRNNWVVDNNRENTAKPGSILSFIPKGIGILYVGVDDSVISGNLVENNDFVGIAISDYCPPFEGTGFDCPQDPTPEEFLFLLDQTAKRNRVEDNVLIGNATPPPIPKTRSGLHKPTSRCSRCLLTWVHRSTSCKTKTTSIPSTVIATRTTSPRLKQSSSRCGMHSY